MRTPLCERLGIEFPIFAFTHCRDVVAAVSRAGGFGVLGAVGFSAEQLAIELDWIDENVGDHPYGVDIVIPGKYEGIGEMDAEKLAQSLREMVPQGHYDFAKKLLADHGVPELPEGESGSGQLLGWTAATAAPQVEIALKHDKVRLIANALGTPPEDVVKQVHDSGRLVAALCGSARQARKHADAGIDIIIAQGGEAGGHTGEIGSVVLWPEVIDAVAARSRCSQQVESAMVGRSPRPWRWVPKESGPARSGSPLQRPTRRRRRPSSCWMPRAVTRFARVSFTGKPARMLKSAWTEAWEAPENPKPLGMPLQYMVSGECVSRSSRYADQARDVMFNPVGQIVGSMNKVRSSRELISDLVEEYADAVERLNALSGE